MSLKGYWIRLQNRLGLLKNNIRTVQVNLYGTKWKFPIINKVGFQYAYQNNTESWIYLLLKQIHDCQSIALFLDVGVNVGQTLIKVKSIDTNIPYQGFEPNTNCLYYTDYLRRLNNLPKADLVPVGLGENSGLKEFFAYNIADSRGTLVEGKIPTDKMKVKQFVPVFRLDDIQKNIPKGLVLLKVDVEGFELEVFRGAKQFIQTHQPVLLFEVLPHENNPQDKERAAKLYQLIKQLGYNIYNVDMQDAHLLPTSDFDVATDHSLNDYCAIHQTDKYNLTKRLTTKLAQ